MAVETLHRCIHTKSLSREALRSRSYARSAAKESLAWMKRGAR